MRTIVIYDQCGQEPLQFFILEGDYTHLDKIYINSADDTEKEQDELSNLIYDSKDGSILVDYLSEFPTLESDDKVIVAGFLP